MMMIVVVVLKNLVEQKTKLAQSIKFGICTQGSGQWTSKFGIELGFMDIFEACANR